MATLADSFDPWGPISLALFETGNADFVEDAVSSTGLHAHWATLGNSAYSNLTRIRARKPEIASAYYALPEEHRGVFVQRLFKALFARDDGAEIRGRLEERLNAIGWGLRQDGLLVTHDALVSELFFPPNSQYDAYVSIRELMAAAKSNLVIVDGYLGNAVLATLRAVAPPELQVKFLTIAHNLKPDFIVELGTFRQQMPGVEIEVRGGRAFHDRFVIVDDTRCFLIGASIKDAGARAFMVSEIEDSANIATFKQTFETAWSAGALL